MSLQRWAAVVALGMILSACGSGSTGAGTAAPTQLRLAIGGESEEGYDPTKGWGRYGSPLFHSTLLRLDSDLKIRKDLATDYSVSDDGLVWTVTIRDDATFTDGEPVTARDVAYTFETAKKQPGLTDVTMLSEAVATSPTTVELRLDEPRSTFVYRLASLGIVPAHAHGKDYARKPVGSGPFTFVQWDRGQQLIVERNDDYYGQKPAFERMVFLFTDEDATLAAARTGDVHLAGVPSTLATTKIDGYDLTAVPSLDNRGIAFPTVPDTGRTDDDGHPIGNDVTADRAVRQAVNRVVDRKALVSGVLRGHGSPATGPVDGAPWYEPRSAVEDDDLAAAVRLLEQAGWTDSDDDGVREKDGTDAAFTLLYPADDTLRQGLALAVADEVERAGIRIEAKAASWEKIDQRLHTDAIMLGWGSHDPTELYNLYSSAQAGVEYYNTGFYRNAAVDRHLDDALAATDPDRATASWKAAQLDDQGRGFSAPADAAWAWLVNLDHTYYVNRCLDLGPLQTEPHGHGWPITAGITQWRWTC